MPNDAKNTRTGTATQSPSESSPDAQNTSGPQSSTSPTPESTPASSDSTASAHAADSSRPRKKAAAMSPQDVKRGKGKPKGKPRGRMGGRRPGSGRKPKHVTELHEELFGDVETIRATFAIMKQLALQGDKDMLIYIHNRRFGKPTNTTAVIGEPPNPLIVEGLEPDEEEKA